MYTLVNVITAVLLPLLPAWILFRKLPSTAKVDGPWQGMKVKLGGAFAGYFVVLLAVFGYFYWKDNELAKYEQLVHTLQTKVADLEAKLYASTKVYTVKGKIKAEGKTAFNDSERESFELEINPTSETWNVSSDGLFTASIPVVVKQDGQTPNFPDIELGFPKYLPTAIHLAAQEVAGLDIRVKVPIELRREKSAYSGTKNAQRPREEQP